MTLPSLTGKNGQNNKSAELFRIVLPRNYSAKPGEPESKRKSLTQIRREPIKLFFAALRLCVKAFACKATRRF